MKILISPHPLLREKAKTVEKISAKGGPASGWDKRVLKIIEEMKEILTGQANPPGIGLAAPQIGINLKIILVAQKPTLVRSKKITSPIFEVFLNPEITFSGSEEKQGWEGCLSLPNIYGFVKRPKDIKFKALNLKGKSIHRSYTGLVSRILQHEIDHLNGILFVDRILEQKGKLYRRELDEKGKDVFIEVKLE